MTKAFENSFLDNRASDRVELAKAFNDLVENIREQIRSDVTLDDNAKTAALEVLDVSIDDLKQDILDRGTLYRGQTPNEQVRTFLESRIKKINKRQNAGQDQRRDSLKGI